MKLLAQPEYGFCRSVGHPWGRPHWEKHPEEPGLLMLTLTCANCRTRRLDYIWRATGELAGRSYRPAEGYYLNGVMKNGKAKPTKTEFRKAWIKTEGIPR